VPIWSSSSGSIQDPTLEQKIKDKSSAGKAGITLNLTLIKEKTELLQSQVHMRFPMPDWMDKSAMGIEG
jgi:hypothetical protein